VHVDGVHAIIGLLTFVSGGLIDVKLLFFQHLETECCFSILEEQDTIRRPR
jgi:hypothetical protein